MGSSYVNTHLGNTFRNTSPNINVDLSICDYDVINTAIEHSVCARFYRWNVLNCRWKWVTLAFFNNTSTSKNFYGFSQSINTERRISPHFEEELKKWSVKIHKRFDSLQLCLSSWECVAGSLRPTQKLRVQHSVEVEALASFTVFLLFFHSIGVIRLINQRLNHISVRNFCDTETAIMKRLCSWENKWLSMVPKHERQNARAEM